MLHVFSPIEVSDSLSLSLLFLLEGDRATEEKRKGEGNRGEKGNKSPKRNRSIGTFGQLSRCIRDGLREPFSDAEDTRRAKWPNDILYVLGRSN